MRVSTSKCRRLVDLIYLREPANDERLLLVDYSNRHGLAATVPHPVQQQQIYFCGMNMSDSRRQFLWNIGGGLGGLAVSQMLARDALSSGSRIRQSLNSTVVCITAPKSNV